MEKAEGKNGTLTSLAPWPGNGPGKEAFEIFLTKPYGEKYGVKLFRAVVVLSTSMICLSLWTFALPQSPSSQLPALD